MIGPSSLPTSQLRSGSAHSEPLPHLSRGSATPPPPAGQTPDNQGQLPSLLSLHFLPGNSIHHGLFFFWFPFFPFYIL